MIVCHCIKDYSFNDGSFKAGEECYYHVDKDGCVFVYKHMSKNADEMFESLDDFHKYFKDCLSFYNGGTYEEEILSNEISKLKKEPYEVEYEMVKIGPRESYMILDVFQYALMKMNDDNLDYLFNNYSREEMAKFGQQFGNMNLKNGW